MQLTERDLRSALSADRFELHYQPQVASRTGDLVGAEALTRLRGEDGNLISPGHFIPIIEGSEFIHDFGMALFERGCADALSWPGITVAVNVSPMQFRDANLARRLIDTAQAIGVPTDRIEIEITEGVFFDHPDHAEMALRTLHEAGFPIALDDFGTGYSSLSYLLRFPVDKIKIDRSFIERVHSTVQSSTIVHALVALARALGLKIVAEGVENEAQRAFLKVAGCHILQGYLFSPALPVDRMTRWYEDAMARSSVVDPHPPRAA